MAPLRPQDPRPPREETAPREASPVQPGVTPLSMRAWLCIVGRIADPAVLLTGDRAPVTCDRAPVPSTQGRLFSAGSEGADLDKRVEDHIKKMARLGQKRRGAGGAHPLPRHVHVHVGLSDSIGLIDQIFRGGGGVD